MAGAGGRLTLPAPSDLPLTAILDVAVDVARAAGALTRAHFGARAQVDFKGAVNPVTEVDRAAERLILGRLRQAFPDYGILGEESGQSGEADGAFNWLVDPIDGTNNYAHSLPHFGICIGLRVGPDMVVGCVYDPLKDEMFAAYRGGGATLNDRPIHVSAVGALADAFLATGFPYSRRVAAFNNTRLLDHFLRRSQGVRRMGSAALDMVYVACGRFDGYWEPDLSPWDVGAAALIVEEAGGRMSDFSGARTHLLSGGEVVASNGLIHADMLRVIRDGAAAPHPDFSDLSASTASAGAA